MIFTEDYRCPSADKLMTLFQCHSAINSCLGLVRDLDAAIVNSVTNHDITMINVILNEIIIDNIMLNREQSLKGKKKKKLLVLSLFIVPAGRRKVIATLMSRIGLPRMCDKKLTHVITIRSK